ncbi:MAG: helix-turn-helix transcriptional regulator [Rikenellaceae bacterium]|nr:helix-turn-helix transcriptional regulator [Rikenellaceae bacterium]
MTNLQLKRKAAKLTQHELAGRSGVSVRTLQYYEQGALDFNKAAVETVYRLAVALECSVEELIDCERVLRESPYVEE